MQDLVLFWFRRDLRIEDNHGLFKALKSGYPVYPVFIFDTEILDSLPENDARVSFIYDTLQNIRYVLNTHYGSGIGIYYGKPLEIFSSLLKSFPVKAVYTNHDYEPYALKRDQEVAQFLEAQNISMHTFKDQVIFEKDEVVKDDGAPYTVYTPYMKKWKTTYETTKTSIFSSEKFLNNLYKSKQFHSVSLKNMGFIPSPIKVLPPDTSEKVLKSYAETRNLPGKDATSYLSPHLRFGTISIRKQVMNAIVKKHEVFLNELIWREFFMQILWHFPDSVTKSFKPDYDAIQWRNNPEEFKAWCAGKTGYPMVDAGMRQLNKTGYMHNRVRMVTASFLVKHLLVDWRWGEAYFAQKLLDYELSSNIGNWQWVAGTGVDAAPYFRIFNPEEQLKKFDTDLTYIRKWVEDFDELTYPTPIVDHKFARERCLQVYKEALNS